jgi:cell wall-associated NlpC family hydrolase
MNNWIVIFLFALLPAFAQAHEQGEPAPATAVEANASAPPKPEAQAHPLGLIKYALSLIGVNYKYGGLSPETGMDCSGFVSHVFMHAAGLALPHNALAISLAGEKVSRNELKPGDLVFFNTLRKAFSHVGIYLGNNRFIHSSSSKTGQVEISDMTEDYWAKRFNGARRLGFSTLSSAISGE